jgi:hypothetical protein
VIVLGPERSGTSLTAKILGELGLSVSGGDRRDQFNQDGYWEDEAIVEVNRQVLIRIGARPNWAPPSSLRWVELRRLQRLVPEARAALGRLDALGEWACKDPRFCITLPFWRPLFLNEPKYVICLRNPLAVARSLHEKDQFSIRAGGQHWFVQMTRALENTAGCDRLLVPYEDFLGDAKTSAVDRIVRFLNLATDAENVHAPSSGLVHAHSSMTELMSSDDVPAPAKRLYYTLAHLASLGPSLGPEPRMWECTSEDSAPAAWFRLLAGSVFNQLSEPVFQRLARARGVFRGSV